MLQPLRWRHGSTWGPSYDTVPARPCPRAERCAQTKTKRTRWGGILYEMKCVCVTGRSDKSIAGMQVLPAQFKESSPLTSNRTMQSSNCTLCVRKAAAREYVVRANDRFRCVDEPPASNNAINYKIGSRKGQMTPRNHVDAANTIITDL